MHAGMSYARLEELGGIQWPCRDEDDPGAPFLHGRLWERAGRRAARRRSAWSSTSCRSTSSSDEFPIRLTTGRRLDSYNTGVQTRRLHLAAAPRRVARPLARGRRAARRRRGRARAGHVAARRGGGAGAHRPHAAPRPRVHDAALPRRGRDERAHHRRDRSEVGHRRVQGERDPGREAARQPADAASGRVAIPADSGPADPTDQTATADERAGGRRGARRAASRRGTGPTQRGRRPLARGGHAARDQRHLLLPALHAVQERVGWISPGALGYVCRRLTIPPAEAYGVATFYALFALEPRAAGRGARLRRHRLQCRGGGELVRGARAHGRPGRRAPRTAARSGSRARASACASGRRRCWSTQAGERAARALDRAGDGAPTSRRRSPGRLPAADDAATPRRPGGRARSCGCCAASASSIPTSLDDYRAHGGYEALRARARARAGRRDPRGDRRRSSLGRGGAAFPTGRKWEAVAAAAGAAALPGLQRRRVRAGHVQGPRADGGRSVRARRGDDDRRASPPAASTATSTSAASTRSRASGSRTRSTQARARGCLGDDVMGHGLRASTSSCAAARAPTSAARRRRSSTRSRASAASRATSRRSRSTSGLFGKPTVVNNVETLVNVLDIVLDGGGRVRRDRHRAARPARKLFCLSGRVARPGVYEVAVRRDAARAARRWPAACPTGATLRAILLGGAAGAFVAPDELDVAAHVRGHPRGRGDARLRRGPGLRRHRRPAPILRRIAAFFRDESCGQCVPCRVGTVRQEEALAAARQRARRAARVDDEIALLDEIARGDARRVDLRPRPDGRQRDRVGHRARCGRSHGGSRMSAVPVAPAPHGRADDRRRDGARAARAPRSSTPAAAAGSTSRRSATARR